MVSEKEIKNKIVSRLEGIQQKILKLKNKINLQKDLDKLAEIEKEIEIIQSHINIYNEIKNLETTLQNKTIDLLNKIKSYGEKR